MMKPGLTILIVDDNAVTRRGLQLLLRLEPEIDEIREADGGAAAVNLVRIQHIDVILMDLRMPGMDPLEAIGRVKAIAPSAYLIAMSMVTDLEKRALASGADLFVEKVELLANMRLALPAANTAAEGEVEGLDDPSS
jgi:CheY-like chemotaxis protein